LDFDEKWLKTVELKQGCAFWGLKDGRSDLWGKIPPKKTATNKQKIGHFMREVDDNEE